MFKKILPHLVAVVTFALLTIIYFRPFYQDMTLSQGDVTQWEGMSKEIVDWNKSHPSDPALWTDAMFGGMPAVQISINFSGNFVTKLFQAVGVVFPYAASVMFMAFLGFYILLLCLDVNPWLSIGGAIAYGLSSFFIISIEAGHNTKVQAMALMSPAIGGFILAYRRNILLGGAIFALFLAMCIDANHPQVAYYMLMIFFGLGLYFFITSILEKTIPNFAKATAVLLIAGVIALLPNLALLWSTQEYAKETMRGGSSELTQKKQTTSGGLDFEYATRWSYGLGDGEMLSLLVPDIKGGVSGGELDEDSYTYKEMLNKGVAEGTAQRYIKQMPLYWGSQPFTSGPVYFGAAIMFLFVFALLIVRNKLKWALLALTLLSILLAAGHNTPFFGWLFNTLPMFNKFRTPSMALVIAEFCVPLLAILGLNELINGTLNKDELLKKLMIAGGITAGFVVLFGVLGGMFYNFSGAGDKQYIEAGNDWLIAAIKKDRASMLRADSFRSLFFIGAAFALIWLFIKQTVSKNVLMGVFVLVFLVDGWMVAKRYLNTDNFIEASKEQSAHTPSQADLQILQDKDPDFRVFNVTRDPFNDAMTSYYFKSVGGYSAVKLIRYQDLIEGQLSKNNPHVLNMLNTKYFIVANPQTKEPVAQPSPYGPCGNAWFVSGINWVKNADAEMAALSDFNEKDTAIVDERYKNMVGADVSGKGPGDAIRLLSYSPNKLTYASVSSSGHNQLAVFSEIFYDGKKGWNAYIDGKPVEHLRVNYVLRGLVIPTGNHNIEFRFEPKSVVTGNKIAYVGSFLLFIFVFGTLGFAGFRKMKELEAEPKEVAKPTPPPAAKPNKKK